MRRILCLMLMGVLLGAAAPAMAQDGQPKTKFYNFDDMLVDGQLKTPDLLKAQARDKAKFKRLLSLKKSFLPKVRETAEERALQ